MIPSSRDDISPYATLEEMIVEHYIRIVNAISGALEFVILLWWGLSILVQTRLHSIDHNAPLRSEGLLYLSIWSLVT